MHVGIAKPEYGIVGGFELLLRRMEQGLVDAGRRVSWLPVDVRRLTGQPFGVDVPPRVSRAQPEFFRYLELVDAFTHLDCRGFDVVVSTQPPSFAVDHPRQLALFSHHHRIYYDLSDVYVAAGFADDPALHAAAERAVRRVDDRYLRRPRYILATSEAVKERLRRFTGLAGNVGVYHAGAGVPLVADPSSRSFRQVVCVSRHEFPKRTELFVHAMKLLPEVEGIAVGGGGRLSHVRAVDAQLSRLGSEAAHVDSRELWLSRHTGAPEARLSERADGSNVRFVGHVDDAELSRIYNDALCVVAPAYLEDYGLTAIEAMHHGKAVVVCSDGGGLVAFVEDGVNGFVVDPTGTAVAEAVRRLREDPALARRMGDAALETAARFTWERTMSEILDGLERVAS